MKPRQWKGIWVKMLEGKVAVVTGASRGIGQAIALELGKQGAIVIVNYQGSQQKAEAVVADIIKKGGQAESYQCNVANYCECNRFIRSVIEKYGRIDILVNNAGITRDGLLMRLSEEDYDMVLDTNLKGTFHCMKFVSRTMLKQRSGRIVNLTSVSGILGNIGQANYAASKAGVIGLTKSVAREMASRGITVNAVAPGFIETDMTESLSDSMKDNILKQIPLGHFGKVEDIALMVGYLVSDQAKYITGQVIHIDGGMAI